MAISRRRLVVLSSAAVLLIIGVIAGGFLVSMTQTSYGRQVIRDYVQNNLAHRVKGKLYVGRIGGGLLTGITIDSLEIRGADDSLFVATGEIRVYYDPRDLLDKRVLISRLEVDRPIVNVTRFEDGKWNFRRIFPSGPPKAPQAERGFGDFVVIDSAVVRDATFTLRMPWHPPDSLDGSRLARFVDSVLTRGSHETARGPEGYVRAWRWTNADLDLAYARLAVPDTAGRRFVVARLNVDESDPPFRFRNVRGDIRWLGDSIWLDLPHFDLPASTGRAEGKVVWGSDLPVRYDVRVTGDSVSLNDVAWVYPTLPRTGGGRMKLHIRNSPRNLNVIDYAISEMDVRSTASRIRGRMTYGVGGPILVVKDVDLEADPLDFRLIRQLNGKEFPYPWRGTITGRVRARGGPLTDFVVDASEFVFRDANVPGAVSIGSARGRLDILYPAFTVFEGLEVHAAQLDLRTFQFLNPNFPRVNGYVSGTATLDSSWLDVRFREADLVHRDGPGDGTRMTGSGRVTWGEQFLTYDLDLQADALSFTTLARSYPALPARGAFRGPLRVRGTVENLDVATVLTGAAGTMAVTGNFDVFPAGYRARMRGSVSGLDLRTLLERADAPATSLTMRLDADLSGDSIADLEGTLGVEVDRSTVDGVRVYPSAARLAFGGQRMRVDSLRLETSAAMVLASGWLGLAPSRRDTLQFRVLVDSLGGLRRWIAPAAERQVAALGTESSVAPAAPDSLGGSLRFSGALVGSVDTLAMAGRLTGQALHAAGHSARVAAGAVDLTDLTRVPLGTATLQLDTVRVAGVGLRSATALVQLEDRGTMRFMTSLMSATGPRAGAAGRVRIAADTTDLRLDSLDLVTDSSRWSLVAPVHGLSTAWGTAIDSLVLRGSRSGRIALRGSAPRATPVDLTLVADSVPLADIGALLQSEVPFRGLARFEWRAEGMRASPRMRFGAALSQARFGGLSLERVSATAGYAERRLDAQLALHHGGTPALRATASLPVDLSLLPVARRLSSDTLRANVRADSVSLALLEAFAPQFQRAVGTFSANVDIGGTWRRPLARGPVTVSGGAVGLSNLGVRLRDIFVNVLFDGDSVRITRLSVRSGEQRGDTLSLTGVVDAGDLENTRFDLRLTARDFHAISRPRVADLWISTSEPLHLDGSVRSSTLTGGLTVTRGEIRIPELAQKRVQSLEDAELSQLVDTSVFANRQLVPEAPPRLLQGLSLRQVQIGMGEDVWLRSEEANIKLGGAVNVTTNRPQTGDTTRTQLALEGTLRADRGTYRLILGTLVQRTFTIEQPGTLRFFGDVDLNPTLDIRAVHTVRQTAQQVARQDVRIQVRIGGTLARPTLELTSPDQRLSQSDLISYLVTGQPSFEVAAIGDAQSAAGLAGNTFLPSLGSWVGSELAGGAVDVVELQAAANTSGLFNRQGARNTVGSLFSGTRLGVGKQIGDRWFVTANTGLCQLGELTGGGNFDALAITESVGLKVETRLPNDFSLAFGSEPSTSALFCTNQNAAFRGFVSTPRQYGFDLFKSWQF